MHSNNSKVLVTGGSGFIGSNFIYDYLDSCDGSIVNLDLITYAGSGNNLDLLSKESRYNFVKGSICDRELLEEIFRRYRINSIVNFAAESHVDRSIEGPKVFVDTNILGTFTLIEAAKKYWESLGKSERNFFRLIHVSTDEVYGSLSHDQESFSENSTYKPNSPYAASKASSDHLVRSYFKTYGFPAIITNCSNNYGPYQFPEKLIPLVIFNALNNKLIPIYGDGLQIRDWLYVKDHCRALHTILSKAKPGSTYNIGGDNEMTNIDLVKIICNHLNRLVPNKNYYKLITHVDDRLGHDTRYSVNASKIKKELGWYPQESFDMGILKTIKWYLNNIPWTEKLMRKN